jgi:hypothetical protein
MATIVVEYRDGHKETFEETSRAGGSYHTSSFSEPGLFCIKDAYGAVTRIPLDLIQKTYSY